MREQLTKEALEVKILNGLKDFLMEKINQETLKRMNVIAEDIIWREEGLGTIQYNRYKPVIRFERKTYSVSISVIDIEEKEEEDNQ